MIVSTAPKRLILFAGYSESNNIRTSDIALISELSRYGDVHCMYDNTELSTEDLAKIDGKVSSFSVRKHGEYDFGSWKYLYQALDQNIIDGYDELILTNNSLLILNSFENLFNFRSARPEDFFSPVLIDEDYLEPECFIEDYKLTYDKFYRSVMYLSAFWSLRHNLFQSHMFRHFINAVQKHSDRLTVCYRYERGFSRSLWRHGISTCTFLPKVYRHVPLYTEDAFMLVQQGLPFIKYKALAQTYYPIPDIINRCRALLEVCHPRHRPLLLEEVAKQGYVIGDDK